MSVSVVARVIRSAWAGLVLCGLPSCTGPTGAQPGSLPPAAPEPSRPAPAPVAAVAPSAAMAPSLAPVATQAPEEPIPDAPPFRPADFSPPHAITAAEADGKWRRLGSAERAELAAENPALMYRTTVHPHRRSRFVSMDVVAFDLRSLKPGWVLGKKDKGADAFAKHSPAGLIPNELQAATVAVFNGGFLARHGRWGMMSHGEEYVPPRPSGCTVALGTDGSTRIGTWETLPQEGLVSYRQSPPCLLEEGTIHPHLLSGRNRAWAGLHPTRKTRRRSALGINEGGTILYYALGTETQAIDLARGMAAVGAQNALQLDINWNWTRLLLVGRRDEKPRVTSTLIKDVAYGKNEYFSYPSDRDFFFMARSASPGGSLRLPKHLPDG